MQLTVETYVASVAMLSQVIEDTENAEVEQNSGVLGSVANYFGELAVFVNTSNITINVTVSLYSNSRLYIIFKHHVHLNFICDVLHIGH